MVLNRQWLIATRPLGRPLADSDFTWTSAETGDPAPGEVLVRIEYLGFDPAQKGWMENAGGYTAPTEIGDVMRATGIGEVVASRAEGLAPGDKVSGMLGWQDYALLPAKDLLKIPNDEYLTAHLGVFGLTGLTAFFGMHRVGKPFPGDTLVITGAAGATGSVVGQIGRIAGCRVIGIAGGPEKCRWLTETLGFDAAIDYKAPDWRRQFRSLAKGNIDVLWDNVGGPIFNTLLADIALHARVVACGGISRYETGQMPAGPENYFNLIFRRATMGGFLVFDYIDEFDWARDRMRRWVADGRLRYQEDIQHGLENAPRTLMRLFKGENFGKQLLKL
jgi:NADPH-dependent curcumin reductase CurA